MPTSVSRPSLGCVAYNYRGLMSALNAMYGGVRTRLPVVAGNVVARCAANWPSGRGTADLNGLKRRDVMAVARDAPPTTLSWRA